MMELSYSDRRLARERLDRHLLESARELATDWDRVTSVDLSAAASRDSRAANTRALSGLPVDATALEIATALQLLIALRHDVDLLEDGLIKAALDRGMSWEQLGVAYGKTTRQAMHQHAKRLDTRIREDIGNDVYSLPLMAADDTAERDWFIRARVRLLADASTGGAGSRRTAPAGEVLEMMMRGPAGAVVDTEVWQTDEPVLDALLTPADNVVVLEILEEVSPWYDRALGISQ